MAGPMRIALIAPPWLPVPPTGYGGTEAVIDRLATGLQALGHEVLLFTTGDSTCPVPRAWSRESSAFELLGQSLVEADHLLHAYERVSDYDIVHDHSLLGPLFASEQLRGRLVVTNHGPFTPEARTIVSRYAGRAAVVAISADQASRSPIPVEAVIHHGLRIDEFPVGAGEGDYLFYLGRFSPDKGAREAALIAREAGIPLLMAAKMREATEIAYFREAVEPLLGDDVRYLGEVGLAEKLALMGSARALLNPIRWPEPFGLVMIEALACGTPVLTRRAGAAPEIVDHGVTGVVCDTDEELLEAVGTIDRLDRQACRRAAEERFSVEAMVAAHVELYQRLLHALPSGIAGDGPGYVEQVEPEPEPAASIRLPSPLAPEARVGAGASLQAANPVAGL